MGAGMDKIIPGLYVGSIRDSRDIEQIRKNNITHILAIYEDPRESDIENIKYLRFKASDHASQDIKQFFPEAIDFIHNARLNNGNVLVHCLAGISRSTSLCISYIMTITSMPWYDSLNTVRAARKGANPNFGFQRQLQNFEFTSIKTVREELYKKYGVYNHESDLLICKELLEQYQQQQRAITDAASKNNPEGKNHVNYNPIKTYPLPFNAYNLDEEKTVNISTNKSNANAENDTKNEKLTNEEIEEFVDNLFN